MPREPTLPLTPPPQSVRFGGKGFVGGLSKAEKTYPFMIPSANEFDLHQYMSGVLHCQQDLFFHF
jgi:hypothetical protein